MPHALITGANRGLGLEHVRQLLKREWTISAAVRDPNSADDLKALDPGDGRLRILPYDASDLNAPAKLKEQVDGPLDILFANAGLNVPKRALSVLSVSDWDKVVDVNLNGALYLAQAVLPGMRAQGGGLIIIRSATCSKKAKAPWYCLRFRGAGCFGGLPEGCPCQSERAVRAIWFW